LKKIILVIGGCKSGKSSYALQTAEQMPRKRKIFVATCVPQDDEMARRVARHQKTRGQNWTTIEEPLNLPEVILETSPNADVMLVDCLTLWLSNILMASGAEQELETQIRRLIDALERAACPIVLVSNEVGTGIVPENKLARQFRDIAGWMNQAVARGAHQVIWMVAGIPVTVKGEPPE
jgi:adenosylcobinamide kinase/adenosylcobinamide-phosphate guanylyltransferase